MAPLHASRNRIVLWNTRYHFTGPGPAAGPSASASWAEPRILRYCYSDSVESSRSG